MKTRYKTNNLIALLIALLLITIGFALGFIHRQSESKEKADKTPVAAVMTAISPNNISSAQERMG